MLSSRSKAVSQSGRSKPRFSEAAAELAADENISPGGCRVETEHGSIDQQIEAQLARILEELT